MEININNNEKEIKNYNDYELNSLPYEEALKIDKPIYINYYFSLLRKKHMVILTFFNIMIIIIQKILKIFFIFILFILYN